MNFKRHLSFCSHCLLFIFFLSQVESKGQSKLIHYWDMNNTLPAGGTAGVSVSPLAAEYSTLGHAYLVYTNSVTTAASCGCAVRDSLVDNGAGGSIINDRHVLGNDTGGTSGGNLYIRTRNPMNNMKFLWYMPTTGYQNIWLKYAAELSSAGKPVQNYSYSLDSGLTFVTTGLPMTSYTPGIAWGLQSVNLSSIAGVNNNPKFIFCISYSGAAAQATSGNDRYDNITLEGDSICPSFTLQPINQTVCSGNSTSFYTHVIGGINNSYQWQVNTGSGFTNLINFGVYSGVNTDSLIISGSTVAMNNFQYRCVVSSGSCGNITTNNVVLLVNATPTIIVNSATICAGDSAILNTAGATSYTWSPATGLSSTTGNSVIANPSTTTAYTVIGTSGLCLNTSTANVVVNLLPTVNIAGPTIICKGQSVTLTASGAATYSWSGGPTSYTYQVAPNSTSLYIVTGKDVNNCSNSGSILINVKAVPTISTNTANICVGSAATLTVSGANTYTWSPSSSLNISTGASVIANPTVTTTYTINGTGTNGCTNSATTILHVNALPNVTATTATVCVGGTATLTAAGANTYTWSTNAMSASITDSPMLTTNYTVTGTDANNCINNYATTVSVNPLPTITSNTSAICVGSTTTLTANGANTYTWSTNAVSTSIATSPTVTTNYTIAGTDANNCVNVGTTTVTVTPLPTIAINSPTICVGATTTLTASGAATFTWNTTATTTSITPSPTVTTNYTVSGTDANNCVNVGTTTVYVNPLPMITATTATICIDGTATLTASGANTYTWSTNAVGTSITPSPTLTTTYSLSGTDANNCVNVGTTTVTVNPLPIITINSSTICVGATTTLTAIGATTYTWSTGSTTTSIAPSPTVTTNYIVNGTDANGCMNVGTTTVHVNPLPIITATSATICVGGTATLTASGANSYTWNTSQTTTSITPSPTLTTIYSVSGTDANNCVNVGTTTVTVNSLPTITANTVSICIGNTTTLTASGANTYTWSPGSGLYSTIGASVIANPTVTTTYTMTGDNGCIALTVTSVTVNNLPNIGVNTSTICIGNTATLTATGANTYTWSTGESTPSITPSPTVTTNYTVMGTDGNNCTNSNSTFVHVNTLPTITVNTATVCVGQTTTLTASGAASYTWNTGSTATSISPSSNITTHYTVTGTDANNCVNMGTTTLYVNSLPIISVNTATICVGNAANLTARGATTYTWNTGITGVNINPIPTANTNYTVVGTDANNCTNIATTSVIVNVLPVINVNTATACAGSQATLIASGANTYTWSNGELGAIINPSPTITTIYTVSGTDVNNCTNTSTTTVSVNQLPTISINGMPIICAGQTTTLMASGVTTYTWASLGNSPSVTLAPTSNTTYTVSGTDINNCVGTAIQMIVVNPLPTITINGLSSTCLGQSATLTASGALNYIWTGGIATTTLTVSPITNTSYTVLGTDANNCVNTASLSVTVNPTPTISISGTTTVCSGQSTVLTASGAISYVWSGGGATATNTVLPTSNTIYTVTGTNAFNCSSYVTKMVTVNPLPNVLINQGTSALNIYGGSSATLDASGAANYMWTSAGNVSCISCPSITESPNTDAEYCVTGMSAAGCTNTACININVSELCGNVFIPDAFSPNGDGQNDLFKVFGKCITDLSMQIFDRWGNKVFETASVLNGWDGTYNGNIMNTGTYIYQASYTLNNGEKNKVKGNLILIR